jgi:hypothetical protein
LLKSKIRSVESFLEKLPNRNSTFKNKVLITDSQSHHKTSKLEPRAIVFSENADLIFSFDGGGDENPSSIQFAEWNSKLSEYEFYSINFQSGQSPIVEGPNPKDCKACHATDWGMTPKWVNYNLWPGTYGENDDNLGKSFQDFLNFKTKAISHPRYSYLFQGEEKKSNALPYYVENVERNLEHMPNARFSLLLTYKQAEQLMGIIEKQFLSANLELLLAYALLQCDISGRKTGAEGEELLKNLSSFKLPDKDNALISLDDYIVSKYVPDEFLKNYYDFKDDAQQISLKFMDGGLHAARTQLALRLLVKNNFLGLKLSSAEKLTLDYIKEVEGEGGGGLYGKLYKNKVLSLQIFYSEIYFHYIRKKLGDSEGLEDEPLCSRLRLELLENFRKERKPESQTELPIKTKNSN